MEAVGMARVGEADSLDFREKKTEGVGEVGDNVSVGWGIFVVFRDVDPKVAHVVIWVRFIIKN